MDIEKIQEALRQVEVAREANARWLVWSEQTRGGTISTPHPNSLFFHSSSLPEHILEDARDLALFLRSEEARASKELLAATGKEVFLCDVNGGCPITFGERGLWEQGFDGPANPIHTTAIFHREHDVSIVEFIRRFVEMVADSLLPVSVAAR